MHNLKNQTLLIIAPHPDDEVIGCAGFIQKVKASGGKVYVLFLTVGDTADFTKKGISTGTERKKEIENVAKFLKFDGYHIAFPGNKYHLQLDTLGQKAIMDMVERDSPVAIEKIKPDIIAFPTHYSYNQDHAIAAHAVHAALRPAPEGAKHFVPMVLSYEEVADNWALQGKLRPNYFVRLTIEEVNRKIESIELYKSQFRRSPSTRSPESLRALSVLRGAESATEYAEGYYAHRTLFK
jgi:LmbE family N-acetylglucosaminyl deacetylase